MEREQRAPSGERSSGERQPQRHSHQNSEHGDCGGEEHGPAEQEPEPGTRERPGGTRAASEVRRKARERGDVGKRDQSTGYRDRRGLLPVERARDHRPIHWRSQGCWVSISEATLP
jgi:hypothetical protein